MTSVASGQNDVGEDGEQFINGGEGEGEGQPDVNLPFLPEEVWEVILWKVKEPQDLYNCLNTCLLWRKIVKSSFTRWIFKEIFPSLLAFLPKEEILSCRLVCKSWNKAVDNTLDNHDSIRPFTGSLSRYHSNKTTLQKWEDCFGNVYRFDGSYLREGFYSIQDVDPSLDEAKLKFWKKWDGMVNHRRRNPFLGSSLKLTIWDQCLYHENGILKEKAANLIRQFGKHLLHISTYSQSYGPSSGALYKFLCYCLESCPHLRKLKLGGRYGGSLPDSVIRQDELQRLPDHSNLETVELATLFHTSGGVAHADLLLERYSNQLQKVEVGQWKASFARLGWSHLTELHVKSFESINVLSSMATMNCPRLKKLSVKLTFEIPSQAETLLRIVNCFPTLAVLRLEFQSSSSPATLMALEGSGSRLVAPSSLKLLEIGRWFPISLPFLAHFPSIQYLHLWGIDEVEGKTDGPSWNSKVLNLLPSLLEITWEKDYKLRRWTKDAIHAESGHWTQKCL